MATILCISDDTATVETQRKLLEESGFTALVAYDKATAIEIMRNQSVDAVVLDFSMLGIPGEGIIDLLMDEQPNLPIAIVSGSLDYIPEPLKWYADELLQKSDDAKLFLSAVDKLIRISKAKHFLGQRRVRTGARLVA